MTGYTATAFPFNNKRMGATCGKAGDLRLAIGNAAP